MPTPAIPSAAPTTSTTPSGCCGSSTPPEIWCRNPHESGESYIRLIFPLVAPPSEDPRHTALLDQARRAHGRLSRQGFRDEDRADPAVVDGFAAALPALGDLRRRVDRHRDRLDRHMPDGNTLWAADRPVIEAHLITLHGDHP